MKKKYGQDGFELARTAFLDAMLEGWTKEYEKLPDRSLETYVRWLTSIVLKGAHYEIVESSKTSVRFRFTACPWAIFFSQTWQAGNGAFFCEADKPMIEAFNDRLDFEITQKLMDGDACCDHHYFLKSSD
ncbi:MAG: L-2-amino-thiazoline-4-carboxylic acid hydrolase [Spirochaetaceae bacterium]|nr:MAG: L-2-amino-thiazoline-4-carboxylic acid hydrolase [Spirochaetaceae bacterium]